MSKCTGTVKWFSNKKGFGFIAPTSDNAPTKEEIFVHQTGIVSAGGQFRTLQENAVVMFDVETEADSGKLKAVNVTNEDGTPIVPPPRQVRRPRKPRAGGKEKGEEGKVDEAEGKDGVSGEAEPEPAELEETHDEAEGAENDDAKENEGKGKENGAPRRKGRNGRRANNPQRGNQRNNAEKGEGTENENAPPRDPPFHAKLSDELKKRIADKGIVLGNRTTIDVALGPARVKLGQGGYASVAKATAVIGEGTFTCDENAKITLTWERALEFAENEWRAGDAGTLLKELSLVDDEIGPVKDDETANTLWGDGKPDPRAAFEANGFLMRRVVLTRPPRPRRYNNRNKK